MEYETWMAGRRSIIHTAGIDVRNYQAIVSEAVGAPEVPNAILCWLEAPSGLEPLNRGFADLSLSHLGTAPHQHSEATTFGIVCHIQLLGKCPE
jgi:hypothetical protein